jgi:hypothetical protein
MAYPCGLKPTKRMITTATGKNTLVTFPEKLDEKDGPIRHAYSTPTAYSPPTSNPSVSHRRSAICSGTAGAG